MVLSAIDYAKQVLNATSNTDTAHLTGEVDDTEFEEGPYDGAAFFADYTTNDLYFYHPLYTPSSPAQGVVSGGDLAPGALSRLAQQLAAGAPDGHPWADNPQAVVHDINIDGLVLLVVGVAVVVAAGIFSGGTALALLPDIFWVIMGGAGIAIIGGGAIELALGGVASGLNAVLNPSPVGNPVQNGNSTCQQYSGLGGCYILCVNADGTSSTTACPGGVGGDLTTLAIGIGAILAVGIGGYVAYRYVSNRPSPGFGTTPPLRQRYRVPFQQYSSLPPTDQYPALPAS